MISKGEIMKLVYGENYTGIDSAVPQHLWEYVNTRIHVVNYNGSHGVLENIILVAMQKHIALPSNVLAEEFRKCSESDEYFYNNYCHLQGEPWYSPKVFEEYQKRTTEIRKMVFTHSVAKKEKKTPIEERIVHFREWKCRVVFGRYGDDSLAISLVDAKSGEPIATCSTFLAFNDIPRGDIPSNGLHSDQCYIKTWGGNEGIVEALVNAGIVKEVGLHTKPGGHDSIAVLVELLK